MLMHAAKNHARQKNPKTSRSKNEVECRQKFAGFLGIPVQHGMKTQARGNVAQKRPVFDVGDVFGLNVRNVQGEAINVEVWFADMNEGGNNEEIDELLKVEPPDAVLGNLAAFVANHRDAQSIDSLKPFHQIDGVLIRLGLLKKVGLKVFRSEWSGLIKNDLPKIFIEGHFAFLVDVVRDVVTMIDFFVIESEMFGGLLAEISVPTVGKKDAANVEKKGGDRGGCHAGSVSPSSAQSRIDHLLRFLITVPIELNAFRGP